MFNNFSINTQPDINSLSNVTNEVIVENEQNVIVQGTINPDNQYYAKLKKYNPDIDESTNESERINKLSDTYHELKYKSFTPETAYTCKRDKDTARTNTVLLNRLPFDKLLLIKNSNSDTYYKTYKTSKYVTNNECQDLVSDTYAYKYEDFAENYDFFVKKLKTGGKRSKSRRQKRSAKKSRKTRKSSKK